MPGEFAGELGSAVVTPCQQRDRAAGQARRTRDALTLGLRFCFTPW